MRSLLRRFVAIAAAMSVGGAVCAGASDSPIIAPDFAMPLKAPYRLTSNFGFRLDPITGKRKEHPGVDWASRYGSTVFAAGAGRVITAEERAGFGLLVEIDHGGGWLTRYAHLSEAFVGAGSQLRDGDTLGAVGAAGENTGGHLHFEIWKDGVAINPGTLLPEAKGRYRD
jgi:murein DD-endopeptidase MepM/ murein hydrolase activator NlpD